MSKKDYQAIARAIYRIHSRDTEGRRYTASQVMDDLREAVADALAAANSRFDRDRFLEACETGTTKGMRS